MTKLSFHPAEETAKIMDQLGKTRVPFVFAFNFDLTDSFVIPTSSIDDDSILFEVDPINVANNSFGKNSSFDFTYVPPSFDDYKAAFDRVKYHLYRGNSYLLNLTFQSKISTNLSLSDIFYRCNARYKMVIQDRFVVFSPETFVTIHQNRIYSFPMKGTISAEIPDAERIILNDQKELAEHYTIVDLIRNDLNMVSKKVGVNRFRYIDRIHTHKGTLLQVSSEISGILEDNWESRIGTIILQMLPAGSVSGAPKQKTVEIIKETEKYDRGFYTGVFGYFDGKDLKSAVLIRFIEQTPEGMFFKSGGGITIHSDCESEYQELIHKIYVPII